MASNSKIRCTATYIAGGILITAVGGPMVWWKLFGPTAANIKSMSAQGDMLVQAIGQYKQDFGCYPSTLEDLVPEYIANTTPPVLGRQWTYVYFPEKDRLEIWYSWPIFGHEYYNEGDGWERFD